MKLHDHMCAAGFLGKVKGNPENSCLIESYSPFCIAFFSGGYPPFSDRLIIPGFVRQWLLGQKLFAGLWVQREIGRFDVFLLLK